MFTVSVKAEIAVVRIVSGFIAAVLDELNVKYLNVLKLFGICPLSNKQSEWRILVEENDNLTFPFPDKSHQGVIPPPGPLFTKGKDYYRMISWLI